MFGSKDRQENGSTRVSTPDRPHGTTTDADVTARMAGTAPAVDGAPARHAATTGPGMVGAAAGHDRERNEPERSEPQRYESERSEPERYESERSESERNGSEHAEARTDEPAETRTITSTRRGQAHAELEAMGVRPARTSAAAAFALVFGICALLFGLTGILAPAAVVFGLVGIVLGVIGRRMGLRPGVTGRGVATGGMVTAVIGLLLGVVVLGGLAVYVQQKGLNGVQQLIDDSRAKLPSGSAVVNTVR